MLNLSDQIEAFALCLGIDPLTVTLVLAGLSLAAALWVLRQGMEADGQAEQPGA